MLRVEDRDGNCFVRGKIRGIWLVGGGGVVGGGSERVFLRIGLRGGRGRVLLI